MEKADGPLPNTRSTMYYQLSAFVDEARACEALPVSGVLRARLRLYASWPLEHTHAHTRIISRYYNPVKIWQRTRSLFTAGWLFNPPRPAGQRAKPWAYTLKPRPSDAVANMAVIDAVYRMAGLAPRRSTQPLARPKL